MNPNMEVRTGKQSVLPVTWSRAATAAAIPFGPLVDALAAAAVEHHKGLINSPERLSVPLAGEGVCLSMPASASDIAIHKLVNVQPANAQLGAATLQGVVTVSDAHTGQVLCFLDGPEVTGRRTSGISLLGIRIFLPAPPEEILLIGTGAQAAYHLAGIAALHPACRVLIRGTDRTKEEAFCRQHAAMHYSLAPCPARIPDSVRVVIALTTSKEIVYDLPASRERLVIGAGAFKPEMAEIGAATLRDSLLFVDDPGGARHEAGDLIRADVDWKRVLPLAAAISDPPSGHPVVLKSVGAAAWDLAAARVALARLANGASKNSDPANAAA